jgi:hypothetical protein
MDHLRNTKMPRAVKLFLCEQFVNMFSRVQFIFMHALNGFGTCKAMHRKSVCRLFRDRKLLKLERQGLPNNISDIDAYLEMAKNCVTMLLSLRGNLRPVFNLASRAGLPNGIFANQKAKFSIFCKAYCMSSWNSFGHLVYFI